MFPRKTVTQYGNTKQWFNKDVRRKIVDKDLPHRFKDTDPDAYRKAKSDLKNGIRDAKQSFKTGIEEKFATDDSREVWANMNLVTQYKGHKRSADSDDTSLPDKLNDFYAKFDKANTSELVSVSCDESPLVIEKWRVQVRETQGTQGPRSRLHFATILEVLCSATYPCLRSNLQLVASCSPGTGSLQDCNRRSCPEVQCCLVFERSSTSGTDTCTSESVRGLHSTLHQVVTAERTR